MKIDLDKHFRPDSKAREVAEILLSGEPRLRQEIALDADVAVTNVNRVISVLEGAGASFIRTIADDGHQVVIRLSAIGDPPRKNVAPTVSSEARIVGASQQGDDVIIEFESEGVRWRGKMMKPAGSVPFLKRGVVRSVEGTSLDALMVRIDVEDETIPLAYIVPVE